MKFSLLLVGLVGAVGSMTAAPVFYNLNFTLDLSTLAPSAGSFSYDPSTQQFDSFAVTWNGLSYDLLSSVIFVETQAQSVAACPALALTGAPAIYEALITDNCGTRFWGGDSYPADNFPGLTTFQLEFAGLGSGVNPLADVLRGNAPQTSDVGFFTATLATAAVLEPTSMALSIAGGALLVAWKRRRRSSSKARQSSNKQ